MTGNDAVFVAVAGALTLLVLAYVLRPLWRERSARLAVVAIVAALALAAFGLYRLVGTPAALDPAARRAPATLEDAVAQLEAQLQREPQQRDGWRLLGRAYAARQQPQKAREAFARAAQLAPEDPDVLVEAAEARALADPQHRFDAQGLTLLQRALQLQPRHQRARWFLGISQRQQGHPAEAAQTWEPLLAQVDAATAASLRAQIDAARVEAGLAPLPAAPAAAAGPGLQVRVRLDPALAARLRLRGDASVFVIARAPDGPPMPVAAEKHNVSELPFTTTLDDADSLMPTQKLSALTEVEVFARLSQSGDASAQDGDLLSAPVRVRLPATAPVELVIGQGPP